jgi:hypothetical protein
MLDPNIEVGKRVRLVHMGEDPDPVPIGTEGTVALITELNFRDGKEMQVIVRWDNGRSLSCICPPDILEAVAE